MFRKNWPLLASTVIPSGWLWATSPVLRILILLHHLVGGGRGSLVIALLYCRRILYKQRGVQHI